MSRKNNTDYRIEKKIEAVKPFVSEKKTRTSLVIPTRKRSVEDTTNPLGEGIILGDGREAVWLEINKYNKQFSEMLDTLSELLDILGLSTPATPGANAYDPSPPLEPTAIVANPILTTKITELKAKIANLKGKLP